MNFYLKSCCLLTLLVFTATAWAQSDSITDLLTTGADNEQVADGRVIEKESTEADDQKIRQRLSNIFSELDELQKVDVAVSNSVVTLTGKTVNASAKARARALAMQVDGVVDVENHIEVITDVSLRVDSTLNQLVATLRAFVTSLPMLIIAMIVVLLAWFLGRWLAMRQKLFRRIAPNIFIADLLAKLGWLLITLAGVILALSLLDATSIIGTVLGAAGIIGLAVGFAVKDTVENYISSILLSLRNPFLTRDYVAIGDIEGSVARLTSRATILISADGNHIRIPNATVFKATIINYTRNPQRRFQFKVGVDNDVSLVRAQQLALDTMALVPGVLEQPAGVALIDNLDDSSVSLVIRGWIDQRSHDIAKVRSEAIRQVKQAFDDAGIEMPEPAYRLSINADQMLEDAGKKTAGKQKPQKPEARIEEAISVQDTAADKSVEVTIAEEIQNSDDENLLNASAQHE
jgi:small-conductance mechanosensitive channel